VRDFRTDRILKLELRNESCPSRPDFSLKAYLEEQQTCDANLVMAQIRFQPETLERVRREHFWGLVEESAGATGVAVTLLTHSLEWLAGWVLSFGAKAEALGPDQFRQLVAAEAQKVAAQYATLPVLPPVTIPLNNKSPRRAAHLTKVS